MAWYNASWGYRKKITVDKTKVGADETNYPVLVNLASDAQLSASAQADGDDILFTSSDETTKLDHEIELYTTATGALIAWVEVDSLSSLANTVIYMYYGNAGCSSQQNVTGTWNSNYKGVWHSKDDPDNSHIKDSTGVNNGNKLAANAPAETDGKIGKAQDYDDTDDYVLVPYNSSFNFASSFTVECWIKADYIAQNAGIISKGLAGSNNFSWSLAFPGTTRLYFAVSPNGISITQTYSNILSGATWYHIVIVYDDANNKIELFENKVSISSETFNAALYQSTANLYIGAYHSLSYTFGGLIDEVRILNVAKTSTYITTTYNNQSSPSTFYALGAEETAPATGGARSFGSIF